MPSFDVSLLGLMGISSATYLGLKINEPSSPKTTNLWQDGRTACAGARPAGRTPLGAQAPAVAFPHSLQR